MAFPRASQALSRLTVLDLTYVRSGPTCVRQLADWGANVGDGCSDTGGNVQGPRYPVQPVLSLVGAILSNFLDVSPRDPGQGHRQRPPWHLGEIEVDRAPSRRVEHGQSKYLSDCGRRGSFDILYLAETKITASRQARLLPHRGSRVMCSN